MNEFNFAEGVGLEENVSFYGQGILLGVKVNEIKGTDGQPIKWYSANIMVNNVIYQNVTMAKQVYPEELELFKPYEFGIQLNQEIDKRGVSKFYIKIVYITSDIE